MFEEKKFRLTKCKRIRFFLSSKKECVKARYATNSKVLFVKEKITSLFAETLLIK
jgi:hypothetical protein